MRVTHRYQLVPVRRITGGIGVPSRRLRRCNGFVTGMPRGLVSRAGMGGDGLVLMATVAPAGTKVNGAAISVNLTLKLDELKGGGVITLHRPSLNPYFNVGNKTTNNNCTRILPVRGVGLRFANSFRTVASTRGVVTTLLSGCVCRRQRRKFTLGRIL